MDLVNKEDDLPFPLLDLFQDRFQTVLKFTSVFRTCNQGPYIKGKDLSIAEGLRDITVHDPLGKTFDNRGLSHPRLADQDRIILCPPGEDLDHTPDLIITTDNRVQLALAGNIGQVSGIFLQSLILPLRVLVRDPLAASDINKRLQEQVLIHPFPLQYISAGRGLFIQDGKKKMLLADILVLHRRSGFKRLFKHLLQPHGGINLPETGAAYLRQSGEQTFDLGKKRSGINPYLPQDRRHNAVCFLQQHSQEMLRLHLLMSFARSHLLGCLQRRL